MNLGELADLTVANDNDLTIDVSIRSNLSSSTERIFNRQGDILSLSFLQYIKCSISAYFTQKRI